MVLGIFAEMTVEGKTLPEVGYQHTSLNFCAASNRLGVFFRTKPHFNVKDWPNFKSEFLEYWNKITHNTNIYKQHFG
jgi:hypothetical protein